MLKLCPGVHRGFFVAKKNGSTSAKTGPKDWPVRLMALDYEQEITNALKNLFLAAISFLIFLSNAGCSRFSSNENYRCEIREAVMHNGMAILTQTDHGDLEIKAGQGSERSYKWDGKIVDVELIPRCERWYGTLGLISPNHIKKPHPNVVILNIDEYQVNYDDFTKFLEWKTKYASSDDVYRDDGLSIRFLKKVSPEGLIAIHITVCQVLIDGEKPNSLPGSQNNRIKSSNTPLEPVR